MISAHVLADSISPEGHRLTSLQITCHRWILAEINTHRALSKGYRSSRAVPVAKLLEEVRTNPAMPVAWLKNKPGMQGGEAMSFAERKAARVAWQAAAASAVRRAQSLGELGLHKQWANRVLEPFLWVHGVISATEWANFFQLRCHPDAQPEFQELALAIRDAIGSSTPFLLAPGQWHLPYVNVVLENATWDVMAIAGRGPQRVFMGEFDGYRVQTGADEWARVDALTARKVSAARCCRVSYKPFDADRPSTIKEDLALCRKLAGADPIHASPFEHQATPDEYVLDFTPDCGWTTPEGHRNFQGWVQHRHLLETIPSERLAA